MKEDNILMIDNFDSFTYNLVDEFEKRKCGVLVYRNNTDMKTIDEAIKKIKLKLIVISPGPSNPKNAGNSLEIIKRYHKKIPVFGVCLGHQAVIEAFGGKVGRAIQVFHGKPSLIEHDGKGIFRGIENPFQAGRYHSLVGTEMPDCLEISAKTEDGVIMAVRHKTRPVEGVQFHPESILTPVGGRLIENLIRMVDKND